jgi:hypothetical protein
VSRWTWTPPLAALKPLSMVFQLSCQTFWPVSTQRNCTAFFAAAGAALAATLLLALAVLVTAVELAALLVATVVAALLVVPALLVTVAALLVAAAVLATEVVAALEPVSAGLADVLAVDVAVLPPQAVNSARTASPLRPPTRARTRRRVTSEGRT